MRLRTIAYPLALCLILLGFSVCSIATTTQEKLSVMQIWLEDPNAVLTEDRAMELFSEGKGRIVESSVFRLGSQDSQIWLLLTATNLSSHNLQQQLVTGVPHSRFLKAILVAPGQMAAQGKVLLDEHEHKAFKDRNNRFRLVNSNKFEIKAGETAQILVQALLRGPSYLPLSLISPDEFTNFWLRDSVFAAQFYVFEATLGLVFLIFGLAVKNRVAVLYAIMFLLGLLAMADIDGHAFHWLWPNSPVWNSWSPLVVLPLLNALGFVIIQQILQTFASKRFQYLKPLALICACISLLLPALLAWFPFSALVQAENVLSIVVFILQPVAFTSWVHLGRRNRASWLALLTVSLIIAAMIITVFVDITLPAVLTDHMHHAAYLLVGIMIMSVITLQLMGIRKDQENAILRELATAKRDAEMNQALFKAEQKYSHARQLAQKQQRQLASASHDLRQPITSLRATIDAVAATQDPDMRRQLHDAFDYLEKLCNQYLQDTRPEHVSEQTEETVTEAYPASLILNTVQRMFAEEAISRHIELHVANCSVLLQIPPLVLMRMVSNIVANAIKHHPVNNRAKVLLGCRRKSRDLHILICDNGAGMTAETLADLQQPYRKGSASEGEGLGLAIVQQLATENGISLRIHSEFGKGSCFIIETPRANTISFKDA